MSVAMVLTDEALRRRRRSGPARGWAGGVPGPTTPPKFLRYWTLSGVGVHLGAVLGGERNPIERVRGRARGDQIAPLAKRGLSGAR